MPLTCPSPPLSVAWFPIHLHSLPQELCEVPLHGMLLSIEWAPERLRTAYGITEWSSPPDNSILHFLEQWPSIKPRTWPDSHVFFSVEGVKHLDPDIKLQRLRDCGLDVFQLYHPAVENNYISPFSGLTTEGKTLLHDMATTNMILDLSHLYGPLLEHVLHDTPCRRIVSHVVCDDMLDTSIARRANAMTPHELLLCDAMLYGIPFLDDIVCPQGASTPSKRQTDISLVARHIQRMADIVGVERVALGPDYFDAASMSISHVDIVSDLDRPEGLARLRDELCKAGWLPHAIEAVFFKNAQRVFLEGSC